MEQKPIIDPEELANAKEDFILDEEGDGVNKEPEKSKEKNKEEVIDSEGPPPLPSEISGQDTKDDKETPKLPELPDFLKKESEDKLKTSKPKELTEEEKWEREQFLGLVQVWRDHIDAKRKNY